MFQPRSARKFFLTAALLAGLAATSTQAAPINYGDFSDIPPGSVMYLDVTESSSSDPTLIPFYGAPSINGDTLDFNPTTFGAFATGTSPSVDLTEGQLNFSLMSQQGIVSLDVSESGDITLVGTGTAVTNVGAGLFAQVEITHVNGAELAQEIVFNASSSINLNLEDNPGSNQPWALSLNLDFLAAIDQAGLDSETDQVTKANVVVNNTLTAFSEPNTIAQVAKKDFNILTTVPEPTSLVMLGLGAVGLLGRRRR